jgi:hypothetical protein
MASLPPPPPPPPPPPDATGSTIVPPGGLTTWASPDPSTAPAGSLAAGAPIRVTERLGAWARVTDPSGAAWWVDGRLLAGDVPTAPAGARSSGTWLLWAVVIAAVAVGAFLLTRDGGGDQVTMDELTPEEQAVAESLSGSIATSEGLGGMGGLGVGAGAGALDAESTDCISAGVVRDIGIVRLEELGVTASGSSGGTDALGRLTEAERGQVADRILGCVDLEQVIADGLAAQGLDPAVGGCFLDKVGRSTIRELLVVGLSGEDVDLDANPEIGERLMAAFLTCMPEDLDLDLGG